MGQLDGAWGYLSGAIESAADNGIQWRKKFQILIDDAGLDVDLIDPTDKPGGEPNGIGEAQVYQRMTQQAGRFKELQQYVKDYRHLDLRFTDYSDFLVIKVDPLIAQWGTADEVYHAEDDCKPLFVICEGGLYSLPRWLFGVVDHIESDDPTIALAQSNVYLSEEDVIRELILLDSGQKPLSREWVLVRKKIEIRRNIRKSKSHNFPV